MKSTGVPCVSLGVFGVTLCSNTGSQYTVWQHPERGGSGGGKAPVTGHGTTFST